MILLKLNFSFQALFCNKKKYIETKNYRKLVFVLVTMAKISKENLLEFLQIEDTVKGVSNSNDKKYKIFNQLEQLTLKVRHLIPFIWFRCENYCNGFPLIKFTYLGCLKVVLLFLFSHISFAYFYAFTGQRRIQIPIKHLRGRFLQNYLTAG